MVLAVTWIQAAKGVAVVFFVIAALFYLLDKVFMGDERIPVAPKASKTPPPRPVAPLPHPPVRVGSGTPSPEEVFPHLRERRKPDVRYRRRR